MLSCGVPCFCSFFVSKPVARDGRHLSPFHGLRRQATVSKVCRVRRHRSRLVHAAFEPIWDEPSPDSIVTTDGDIAEQVTVSRLLLRFQDEIGENDAKALLCEYARQTCAEEGVLRCDVLRLSPESGNSDHVDKDSSPCFVVWTVFANLMAKARHEQTSHANKIRVLLKRSDDHADNAVAIAKLAEEVELYRTYWPLALNGWKSSTNYDSPKSSNSFGPPDPAGPLRRALSVLLENVGLEDAVVLVANARVSEDYYIEDAKNVCAQYVQSLLKYDDGVKNKDGIVRVGVLSTVGDPRKITVLQVHDKKYSDGASFDNDLGTEMLDDTGWQVNRYSSVFPDLGGWHMVDIFDRPWKISGKAPEVFELPGGENLDSISIGELYRLQQGLSEEEAEREVIDVTTGDKEASDQVDNWSQKGAEVTVSNSLGAHVSDKEAMNDDDKTLLGMSSTVDETTAPCTQRIQLKSGNGAFADIEDKLRRLCGKKTGQLRVYIVSGWNTARLQPLLSEFEKGMDDGTIDIRIGSNVFGASATISKVAAGVASARMHGADVIVGFGGGAVMDTAKAIAALLNLSPGDVSKVLSAAHDAAARGNMALEVKLGQASAPLMLIAGTVGSGAEIAEQAVLNAVLKKHSLNKRIAVYFSNATQRGRIAIADPRLVIPRRMSSQDAAMGGLQAFCFALDAVLCPNAPDQARKLASRALGIGSDAIIRARREPVSSDGPARDDIVECSTYAALAREACGGLGLATCISLSLLDGAEPTIYGLDAPLRVVLPRIMAAMIVDACPKVKTLATVAARLILESDNASPDDLARWLLMTAEDIGVQLLDSVGVHVKDARRAAEAVVDGQLVSSCADPELVSVDRIVRIIEAAASQEFEL